MTQGQKSYYDVLGVSRTATDADIKKRYRQLVRQHHPDVAEDKEAAKAAFIVIAEAYQTLINADRRVIYDASIDMQQFKPPTRKQETKTAERPRNVDGPRPENARPSNPTSSRRAEVERWLREARKAYGSGQFRVALDACREARKLDSRNAEAHSIPGDIYRVQGRVDDAIQMYTMAVQMDPRDLEIQMKLERVIRQSRVTVPDGDEVKERKASLRVGLNFMAMGLVGVLFGCLYAFPGQSDMWFSEHLPFIGAWNFRFVGVVTAAGIIIGMLLSMNEAVQNLDDELIFPSIRAMGMKSVSYPIGMLLVIVDIFSFYLSAGIYLVIAWLQESLSRSIMRVFAATLGLIGLSALSFGQGASQALLFSGNLAFIGIVVGWGIGDLFHPRW